MRFIFFPIIFFVSTFSFAQKTETRAVSSFNKLESSGSPNVVIENGSENSIRIESTGVDPEKVVTEVMGDVLKIDMKKGIYKNVNVTVYVTYKDLLEISNSGSGNLHCKSNISGNALRLKNSGSGNMTCDGKIKAEEVSFDSRGSGNVKLASVEAKNFNLSNKGSGNFDIHDGKTINLSVDLSGSGNIEALGLEAEMCLLSISGSGNISVTANKTIQSRISGSGNITYKGDAAITKVKSSGSGEVHRR